MGKGKRYNQEYKDMIVDLFKSGMSLAERSSEYGIAKSTIIRIYKANKGIDGAPRIHHILGTEGLENVFKGGFATTSINEKWVGDITYIHTIKDGWCYLASVLDLHSKKIIGYAFGKKMTNHLDIKALKNW